jgi:hypothetical protein
VGTIDGNSEDDCLGYALASGDFDGDGTFELAASAPLETSGKGRIYVFFVDDGFAESGIRATDASFGLVSGSNNDHLGYALHFADLDGDGFDDLVVCAPDDDDGGSSSGVCWLVAGSSSRSSGAPPGTSVNAVDTATITGDTAGDQLGLWSGSLASGDIDADGIVDLVVGVPGDDDAAAGGGSAWIFAGGTLAGAETRSSATWVVNGDGALGTGVRMDSDIDGDGIVDLLAGAPTAASAGRLYLWLGGADPGTYALPGDQAASWVGENLLDGFGTSVSGAVDLDLDGRDDFAVAAPGSDEGATDAGKVYVLPVYP